MQITVWFDKLHNCSVRNILYYYDVNIRERSIFLWTDKYYIVKLLLSTYTRTPRICDLYNQTFRYTARN